MESRTILILGGAGMVGQQVAREAIHELRPSRIVISALTKRETDEALEVLRRESAEVEFVAAPGDIFLPEKLQGIGRAELIAERAHFDELFADIFSRDPDAYRSSALYRLIEKHRPEVVVDCINTATAIAYLDVFTVTERTKLLIDALQERRDPIPPSELQPLIHSVRELMLAQGVPQIVRHIVFLHRALEESSVRIYVKIGTTGTGGMGINIPYTHSEDKPSAQLLSKSAIGFAHTGLLFLLARTPGAIVKEIKPGAMIGFKRLGETHVRLRGDRRPASLVEPRDVMLDSALDTHEPAERYRAFEGRDVPLVIIGADTGENGFFSIGEFQAITYPQQMESVTPEEVARITILEILGASTGRDVLSAIDGAITEPSYRAGVLREQAVRAMQQLEATTAGVLPSIAVGHLGPPKLSKLLMEAYLLREVLGDDVAAMLRVPAEQMRRRVEEHLAKNPRLVSLIVTVGIPLLRAEGGKLYLTRGPRINIPTAPPGGGVSHLDGEAIERYAESGWVDLRVENFELWRGRIERLSRSRPDIVAHGSAAFDSSKYSGDRFVPGDVVGWLLTNEADEQGMVGRRMF